MTVNAERKPEDKRPDTYEPLKRALPVTEQLQGVVLRRARTGILRMLREAGARTVLDVCCGSGCLACRLSVAGLEVTAVDSSPTMLYRAKSKHRSRHLVRCDAARMPFSRAFDAAIVSLALHEMSAPVRTSVWMSMRRAVKPDGLLIALDFTVPKSTRWYGRTMSWLIDKDEKQIGGIDPAHYENYREFMRAGGLEGWIHARERSATARHYGGGSLGVYTVIA